jgi:hypothetical protein
VSVTALSRRSARPAATADEGEGVCSAFERPQYQVVGKTAYDQLWANRITEAGVAGCGWAATGAAAGNARRETRADTEGEAAVALAEAEVETQQGSRSA